VFLYVNCVSKKYHFTKQKKSETELSVPSPGIYLILKFQVGLTNWYFLKLDIPKIITEKARAKYTKWLKFYGQLKMLEVQIL